MVGRPGLENTNRLSSLSHPPSSVTHAPIQSTPPLPLAQLQHRVVFPWQDTGCLIPKAGIPTCHRTGAGRQACDLVRLIVNPAATPTPLCPQRSTNARRRATLDPKGDDISNARRSYRGSGPQQTSMACRRVLPCRDVTGAPSSPPTLALPLVTRYCLPEDPIPFAQMPDLCSGRTGRMGRRR